MDPAEMVIAVLLIIVGAVGLGLVASRMISRRAIVGCAHPEWIRYWFKGHKFARHCKACGVLLERGRDPRHRYPDGAPGVRRGRAA